MDTSRFFFKNGFGLLHQKILPQPYRKNRTSKKDKLLNTQSKGVEFLAI